MADQVAKLIGGAGTGKTTELMAIMGRLIATGIDPMEIGFSSFTRNARAEAAERVEKQFGVKADALQKDGWFRTVLAICFKQLGGGKTLNLITDTVESKKWIEEALGESVAGFVTIKDDPEAAGGPDDDKRVETSRAAVVLNLWGYSRNRLISMQEAHQILSRTGMTLPSIGDCVKIVEKYERQKYIDDRNDFADLAGAYAGWKWNVNDEPDIVQEIGDIPDVPVWIFDEHQDSTMLLHSVALRLSSAAKWAYFAADPFQALYSHIGATPVCFLELEADKERTMQKSWRCPKDVMELGEHTLRGCSDYFDRGVQPREVDDQDYASSVEYHCSYGELLDRYVKPGSGSWLMIARTNHLAKRFCKKLDQFGVPWSWTKGEGGYATPTQRKLSAVLNGIERGSPIYRDDWKMILKHLKTGSGDDRLLERGAKKDATDGLGSVPDAFWPDEMTQYGATELLEQRIMAGQWGDLVDNGRKYQLARREWGKEAAFTPTVSVGTIHSVKGSEADNVILLASSTQRCHTAAVSDQEARNAEQRVAYVGVTRARRRLFVLHQRSEKYSMGLPESPIAPLVAAK